MQSDNDLQRETYSPQENEAIKILGSELNTLVERSILLALAHKYTARQWSTFHLWLGIPSAVLAALSGVSVFSNLDGSKILAGILSILVASLTALNTFLDPSRRSSIHLAASNKYDQARYRARNSTLFINQLGGVPVVLVKDVSFQTLRQEFEAVSNELQKLNSESPIIPEWPLRKAKKSLKELGKLSASELSRAIDAAQSFIVE